MWVPSDVEAIERAIANGSMEETSSFDGKRELPQPKKNASVAIDVAAMSTAGGVLLYGVDEDADRRLTVSTPIRLAGAADRLAQIVQTSISEVPHIEFREYPLRDDGSRGYLALIVPSSPRAPHQVTVGDDRRFYGRGARGNRRLSEQEVALLYERRRAQELDRDSRLSDIVATYPYKVDHPDHGRMYAFAQPVPPDQSLWETAEHRSGGQGNLQTRLSDAAHKTGSGGAAMNWRAQGADAYRLTTEYEVPPREEAWTYMTDLTFNIDGRSVLMSAGVAERRRQSATDEAGTKYVFEHTIARDLTMFLRVAGELYDAAGYHGAVDVGVAVTGLAGALSAYVPNDGRPYFIHLDGRSTYPDDTFTRTARLAAASELADPAAIARRLTRRLIAATSQADSFDPFADYA